MQLTRFSDYALRVLMYLAARPGERAQAGAIAAAYGISASHVAKVVHALAAEGFVETHRGREGGIELARAASTIGLGEILRVTEVGAPLVECFDPETNACPVTRACGLKHALHAAQRAFYDELDRYTLAGLVREPAPFVASLIRPRRGARSA